MFSLNPEFPDATLQQKWDQFRIYRNQQLAMTDWTQTLDCPLSQSEKDQFAVYRDFLRTTPTTYATVEEIEFPGWVEMRDYKVQFVNTAYQIG